MERLRCLRSDNRRVDVSVQRVGTAIEIAVRDYGLGIPAEERHEIFKRFVRGAKASRLGIKGTGLGLAMVSHIVDAHGGRIEVRSEEGIGSTFRMVLPHIERPREESEPKSGRVPASG